MGNELKELTEELCKFAELATKEVRKIVQKGDLTPGEIESVYKAACIAEKLQNLCGSSEYDEMSSYGYSGMRGRSPVTGRYISRGMNGYSGHSIEDRMIASLEEQMDSAKSEYERKMILDEINHIRMGTR